ncbi:MAG: precorrin-6y C5,15-methyltransferase (decarboxylating) subunit CbiE [Microlunatus sp.]
MTVDRLEVVGIPAGGWPELGESARRLIIEAEVLIGGRRHLDLVADANPEAERLTWPSPLKPGLPTLLDQVRDRRTVVLASGDPLVSGIGSTLIELLGPEAVRIHPAVSSVALARARMGWSSESVCVVSLVGRDLARVRRQLAPGRRLIVLSAGSKSPAPLAELVTDAGYGPSVFTVLGDLGTDDETSQTLIAAEAAQTLAEVPALNIVAIECRLADGARVLAATPGLPDDAFDHDGQLTKRDLRASALSRLAPVPGELLWDLGAGAGSIAIEWARTDPTCRAIAVERHPERAARIAANAARLGVPGVQVITADAGENLAELPEPNAIFVGGGATIELLDRCWERLPVGGRLVAHAVTVETEQILLQVWQRYGGELVRIGVERLEPLGALHGWKPARPVVQWSVARGGSLL